jgi:hypothetical protein
MSPTQNELGGDCSPPHLGVYGLSLAGVPHAARLLVPAPHDWPCLRIERTLSQRELTRQFVDDDAAEFRLQGDAGTVRLERSTLTAQFSLGSPIDDEAVVHPFLALTAAIASRWLGRDAFHAGAFVVNDGAWAILGKKGAGKSSTLGYLGANGTTIVTDDVLVLESGDALGGPSCVDLRPDAATFLGVGEDLGVVGARERRRLLLPAPPDRVRLRGWVFPTWSDTIELVPIPLSRRLPLLAANLALKQTPTNAARFLDYATLPCWEFRRPKRFDSLDKSVGLLIDQLRP